MVHCSEDDEPLHAMLVSKLDSNPTHPLTTLSCSLYDHWSIRSNRCKTPNSIVNVFVRILNCYPQIIGTVFRKSLRLSGKARINHNVGQITTMISTDAARLDRFSAFAHKYALRFRCGSRNSSDPFGLVFGSLRFRYSLRFILHHQHMIYIDLVGYWDRTSSWKRVYLNFTSIS